MSTTKTQIPHQQQGAALERRSPHHPLQVDRRPACTAAAARLTPPTHPTNPTRVVSPPSNRWIRVLRLRRLSPSVAATATHVEAGCLVGQHTIGRSPFRNCRLLCSATTTGPPDDLIYSPPPQPTNQPTHQSSSPSSSSHHRQPSLVRLSVRQRLLRPSCTTSHYYSCYCYSHHQRSAVTKSEFTVASRPSTSSSAWPSPRRLLLVLLKPARERRHPRHRCLPRGASSNDRTRAPVYSSVSHYTYQPTNQPPTTTSSTRAPRPKMVITGGQCRSPVAGAVPATGLDPVPTLPRN